MEPFRTWTVNGQEVTIDDLDAISAVASGSDDRIIAEFFRLWPKGSGTIAKGVLPYGYSSGNSNGTDPQFAALVRGSGSADAKIRIYPFRALIGATVAPGSSAPRRAWSNLNSVVGAGDTSGPLYQEILMAPTVTTSRCDLVYVKVSLGSVSLNDARYVRDPTTGNITHVNLDVERKDTYTIGVVQGVEAVSPAAPALPTDSGADYYIPLALVYLPTPFTGTSFVTDFRIHEIAPVVQLGTAMGAATLAPGNKQHDPTGNFLTSTPFTVGAGRPDVYLPPSMTGQVARFFAFQWDNATKSPPINAEVNIDDSMDWRNRVFKWFAQVNENAGAATFAWAPAGGPTGIIPGATALRVAEKGWDFGQSFHADVASRARVVDMRAGSTDFPTKLHGDVEIFVDMATGFLKVKTTTDPGACVFVWIEASGQYANP